MKKLSLKNYFGYAMGDLANSLTFGMSAGFLLAFYTDVLGITAAAAGTLFLIARIWDAINDPIMGGITDKAFFKRLKKLEKNGKKTDKFRPYLLKGSWPVIVAAVLMFIAPSGFSMTQKLIWAYVTYIAWGMTYTFINIPYGGLAAVMTQDPIERSKLSISRGLGSLFGSIFPRVIVPAFLVKFADDQAKGWFIVMIILGVIAFASYLVSYFTVEETVETKKEDREKVRIADSFSVIVKNRPFMSIALASIAMLTGLLIQGSVSIYYFRDNLNALNMMGLTGVTMIVPMLAVSPLTPKLVRRFGVKKVTWVSSVISAVLFLILYLLPDNVWIYLVGTLLASLFMMVPNMIVWGMVSDCIDYNQYLSGSRQEGAIYGLYSFVRKMGQAFAGFISGVGLSVVGYKAGEAVQSASTLGGIKFLSLGVPAIGMLVAFIAYFFIWNLTPEKQAEVTAAIRSEA